ncbi:MAG: hypothetical protein EXR24_07215 [Ignavibacteria bacterium]|nr:hypothetical protein [Ignavibacteria bacterium]
MKQLTISELISSLKSLEKNYGKDTLLVYASDDEGNIFNRVLFIPTAGTFDQETCEFVGINDQYAETNKKVNAICIN